MAETTGTTRRRRGMALLAVFAIWFAGATSVALIGRADAASGGMVSGRIIDSIDRPVAGARIDILNPELPPIFTDSQGNFATPALSGGSHQFRVSIACKAQATSQFDVNGNTSINLVANTQNLSDSSGLACRVPAFNDSLFDSTAAIALTGDDAQTTVNLPFVFSFYGKLRTNLNVSTNGFVSFGGPATAFANDSLPSAAAPNAAIYPFWDDLVVDSSSSVRTGTIGSSPSRVFLVQWRNVLIRGTSDRVTFGVALFEGGGIDVQYEGIATLPDEQGASATIGLEDDAGTVALQQSFDTPVLADHTARFYDVNFAPIAHAGPDQKVGSNKSFTLDANASTDPNDQGALAFEWTQFDGPTVSFDRRSSRPTITGVKGPATLSFQLDVVDPFGARSTDQVTIHVAPK